MTMDDWGFWGENAGVLLQFLTVAGLTVGRMKWLSGFLVNDNVMSAQSSRCNQSLDRIIAGL